MNDLLHLAADLARAEHPNPTWLLDELQLEWETMMLNLDDAQKYLNEGRDDMCGVKIAAVQEMLRKRMARHCPDSGKTCPNSRL